MSPLHRLFPAFAAALLAAGAAPLAVAQSKTLGTGKPQGLIMTRAELRECMATQARIKTKRQEAEQTRAELDKEKEDIKRNGDAMKDRLAALDRTNKELVDQYNADATAQDQRIDTYKERTDAFNAKVDALNVDRDAWSKNCEIRRYDEKDELAIKMGK